jgi:MerR family transcriptional regulator, heat shock protein HspR
MQLRIDDPAAPLFTVGQVADVLGVQTAFLRRLDEHDVVRPARSAGGQRRYSREQVDRVADVRGLMGDGLTLAGIRRIFELQARVAELEAELRRERARTDSRPSSAREAARA